MNQMTESAIVGELKEILYNKDHIDVIDALRPNGTFTLDVSDEKHTDISNLGSILTNQHLCTI
jgi:hypothetical protein